MNERKLLHRLGLLFPKNLSEFYDHPGYQTGNKDMNQEVKKVFLCLDFTEACLPSAIKFNPDIIITHHPFFFGSKPRIRKSDLLKAKLEQEVISKLHCPIYSYHTNFDKAKNGMNDTLFAFLGFEVDEIGKDGCLRITNLKEGKTTSEIASYLADKFHFDYVGYLDNQKLNFRIGMVAGGAGNDFSWAMDEHCDLYISGDSAHHARVDMRRYSLNYIELPHECEEIGFMLGMSKALKDIDPTLEIEEFRFEEPYTLVKR